MSRRPLNITVSAHTSASPEQVLDAVTDFTARRPRLWPNVKARYLNVHELGPDNADVTEGLFIIGVFWERERYDWSEPGRVTSVVMDSNVLVPGCRFEVTAAPSEQGGAEVTMHLHRTFRRGLKGRFGSTVNRLFGRRGWASYLRKVLRNLEREPAPTTPPVTI